MAQNKGLVPVTELDYLLELLLDHPGLPEKTMKSLRARIKLVQKTSYTKVREVSAPQAKMIHGAVQAPSMVAKIEAMEQQGAIISPVAQAAIASRAEAMRIAALGKPEAGRTAPRKF